tara:strand:+ start:149 stop:481 length:333 start_codon:yes stop_codon:yes gene_type:complete
MLYFILLKVFKYLETVCNDYIYIHYERYKRGYEQEIKEDNAAFIITEFIRYCGDKNKENAVNIIKNNYKAHLDRKDYNRKITALSIIKKAYVKSKENKKCVKIVKKSSWW